jgi:polyhydroxybutyrate depolymerase
MTGKRLAASWWSTTIILSTLALLLAGCGSSSPTQVAVGASDVPGLNPTAGTVSVAGEIAQHGDPRSYIGMLPQPLLAGAPLAIVLHPLGTSNVQMANLSRAGRLAAQGAVVLLPQGNNGTWNENPATSGGPDDVGFISALIDRAIQQYQVDPAHVYVLGFSDGGFMAERLACDLASRLAGFAAVAALLRQSLATECRPAAKIRAALVNGTSDMINPYAGNIALGEYSAPATAAFWAQQEGCSPLTPEVKQLPPQVDDGTSVTLATYTGCPSGISVQFYTINGGGHTWPGSPYPSQYGTTSQNLDATEALWSALNPG